MMVNGVAVRNCTHILLGVCTYQRPAMLLRCLLSVRRLEVPEGCRLTVVVVDNEPLPVNRQLVESYSSEEAGPFHYVHEPRRGIAQARNAVLDFAASLKADWIAMLDDDTQVSSDWLQLMWSPAKLSGGDVVQSAVEPALPDPLPAWAFPKPRKKVWKFNADHACTNGVLFRAGLADKQGTPLRFDEAFALTGGEDRDLFRRAFHSGARIIWTPSAVATEAIPPSKLTFSAQVGRAYWIEAVNARQDRARHGFIAATIYKSVKFTGALFKGLTTLAFVPFVALVSRQSARRRVLRGCKAIATAAGISSGLLGVARPEPYRTTHGS